VLLAAVVIAVYYPSLYAGVNSIDDSHIVSFFSHPPPLLDILLPGRHYYYRPIVEISYYLDSLLWGMEPRVMHLENLLLHVANSMLVLLLSQRVIRHYPDVNPWVSPIAGLMFALHPLNVEAVSWIAGRTDPMAALFVLGACYFWLRWLDDLRWRDAIVALAFFVCGMLTKEVTVAFLPVAILLALWWPRSYDAGGRWRRLVIVGVFGGLVALLMTVALIFQGGATGMARFMVHNESSYVPFAKGALIAFGFYIKKLFVPMPLNFAIVEVSPFYGLLGGAVLLALAGLFWCKRLAALFYAAVAIMILPAVLVAVRQVAWTPYAERYMYLPTAFLSMGTIIVVSSVPRRYIMGVLSCMSLILCGAALVSLQRNLLWRDNLIFYRDAVAKSPTFGAVYNELGVALMQRGEIDRAAEAFDAADRLNKRQSIRLLIKANVMGSMVAKGNFMAARNYFFQLFKEKKDAAPEFLELLQKADSRRLESLPPEERAALARDVIETLGLLHEKKIDPFWLYRSGQLALIAGNQVEAVEFFRKAHAEAPDDAHYRLAAEKYLKKLVREP